MTRAPITPSATRPSPEQRSAYRYLRTIPTRWMDNDVYGHVNNVTYYSYFDTIVNGYLIDRGALDIAASPVIGLVVETHCNYFSPIAFPDNVTAGLRVAHRGSSSVRYEIGVFRGEDETASAQGHFVHVYVDRASGRPVALPADLRAALEALLVA
jgi:acyl-CoA thioester hydrolase